MKFSIEIYLVLFQKTPFLTFEWLGALFVVAPLDCVAHGRHDGEWWFLLLSAAMRGVGSSNDSGGCKKVEQVLFTMRKVVLREKSG